MFREICIISLLAAPVPANALTIEGIVGSAILKKAGNELTSVVDSAKVAALEVIEAGNDRAEERLNQIDAIVARTFSEFDNARQKSEESARRLLEEAAAEIRRIQGSLLRDLGKVIRKAECSGRRILLEDVRDALGDLGRVVGTGKIVIILPEAGEKTKEIIIRSPFLHTYEDVRDSMEASLAKLTDSDLAYKIRYTYAFIAAFARRASCFYPGYEEDLINEYTSYIAKANKWDKVIKARTK